MLKLNLQNPEQLSSTCKALSTPLRVRILKEISNKNLSLVEIAENLDTAVSTIAANVKVLEESGLIVTELISATRGTKRVCTKNYADIFISLDSRYPYYNEKEIYEINMPIGQYSNCETTPTCGLIGNNGIIGSEDVPSSFFEPNHTEAGLIWLRTGYVEYLFPNITHKFPRISLYNISFSMEICSEAPNYEMDWPSDITFWVNNKEVATWTSPSDFGDRKGKLESILWDKEFFTQYGKLITLNINMDGTYINDEKISEDTISSITFQDPYIKLKIGIKKDANHKGGINLFGTGFGDYNQDIILKLKYSLAD